MEFTPDEKVPLHQRFAFYEVVRVREGVPAGRYDYAGKEGYIGGKSELQHPEAYSVYFEEINRAVAFRPEELESLGYRLTYEQIWGHPDPYADQADDAPPG
jgi:hypothetical protein